MANIKSAIKRTKQAKAANLRNRATKRLVLTKRKAALAAIEASNKEDAATAYRVYTSALDRAVKKGVITKNNAARKKSRMALAIKKMA